jgi:hypothetical protein
MTNVDINTFFLWRDKSYSREDEVKEPTSVGALTLGPVNGNDNA